MKLKYLLLITLADRQPFGANRATSWPAQSEAGATGEDLSDRLRATGTAAGSKAAKPGRRWHWPWRRW